MKRREFVGGLTGSLMGRSRSRRSNPQSRHLAPSQTIGDELRRAAVQGRPGSAGRSARSRGVAPNRMGLRSGSLKSREKIFVG